MTLSEYISEVGAPEFAKRFRISERSAYSYQQGVRKPRPKLAKKIVEGTPVGWDGVYAGAVKRKAN
jgi:hypothetical protein